MNKRQFFTKPLLASLPVVANMLHAAPEDAAAEKVHERIASFAGKITEELTLVSESQMVIWDEMDAEPANQTDPDSDPDYVPNRRILVNGIESSQENLKRNDNAQRVGSVQKCALGERRGNPSTSLKAPKLAGYCTSARGAARPENGSQHDYKVV